MQTGKAAIEMVNLALSDFESLGGGVGD